MGIELMINYSIYLYCFFDIFNNIPISVMDTNKDEPPYDKNGSVTPVTGINPTTTIKFKIVWKAILKVIPYAKYLENLSSWLIDILNPL